MDVSLQIPLWMKGKTTSALHKGASQGDCKTLISAGFKDLEAVGQSALPKLSFGDFKWTLNSCLDYFRKLLVNCFLDTKNLHNQTFPHAR